MVSNSSLARSRVMLASSRLVVKRGVLPPKLQIPSMEDGTKTSQLEMGRRGPLLKPNSDSKLTKKYFDHYRSIYSDL